MTSSRVNVLSNSCAYFTFSYDFFKIGSALIWISGYPMSTGLASEYFEDSISEINIFKLH